MAKTFSSNQEEALIREYEGGSSLKALADQHGCALGTVRNVLVRKGLSCRKDGRPANPVSPTKQCSSCKQDLLRSAYYNEGKRSAECKNCLSIKASDRYQRDEAYRKKKIDAAQARALANPEKRRSYIRQYSTGWTESQFEEAWEKQGGCCAICAIAMARFGRDSTAVCADHNHTTNAIRALLCRQCNLQLGVFEKHRLKFEEYLAKYGRSL